MLPQRPPGAPAGDARRYVDEGIRQLLREFDAMGVWREELEVKLFGGADVLTAPKNGSGRPTVGALNCRSALAVLAEEGIRPRASDLEGLRGRTVQFNTGTGEVLMRRLIPLHSPRCDTRAALTQDQDGMRALGDFEGMR